LEVLLAFSRTLSSSNILPHLLKFYTYSMGFGAAYNSSKVRRGLYHKFAPS